MTLEALEAVSPIDGRYWEEVRELAAYSSERALIQTRFEIEARYLIGLSGVGLIRPLTDQEQETLRKLGPEMSLDQVRRVKEIEAETRHDVKSMERTFREMVAGTSLEDLTEMIHFGLTSDDVNNLAYRLMLNRARKEVITPTLNQLIEEIAERAEEYRDIPMLARTHGQPAVPTTLGKEMAITAVRLKRQARKLAEIKLTGKLNGAVGNYNAQTLAAPEVDWMEFSQTFVTSLGLEPNLFTTQINPYDDMVELFQAFQEVNGILLGFDQDLWRYISDKWLVQELKAGEVGSSTMPQKVNPISFENSEGNITIANGLWEAMGRKLLVSRLQRDLSDTTVIRNVGVALAHGLLAYRHTLAGLRRTSPNLEKISQDLNHDWSVLTEGVQTVLRRAGVKDSYRLVASLSQGQEIGPEDWINWVNGLPVDQSVKEELLKLSPKDYLGRARELTDLALKEIRSS